MNHLVAQNKMEDYDTYIGYQNTSWFRQQNYVRSKSRKPKK
jgi:hypothetical protein